MKKLSYLLAVTLVPLVWGCASEKPEPSPEDKINISTQIESLTKAPSLDASGSGAFASGDVFTLLVAGARSQTGPMDYQVGSTSLYWKDVSLTNDEKQVGFYACYPKQDLSAANKFTFDLEQTQEQDLLMASVENVEVGTNRTVSLRFTHVMHRLVLKLVVDPTYAASDQMVVRCTGKSTCTVDLKSGTLDNSAAKTATFTAAGEIADFLLIPQNTSDVTLEIQTSEDTKSVTLQELIPTVGQLESGKQLTLELAVKNGAIQLQNAAISGWDSQGTVEGEIIM